MSSQHKNAFRGEHITAVYTGVFKACKAREKTSEVSQLKNPLLSFITSIANSTCDFFVLFCDCIKLSAFAVTNAEFRMKRARAVSGAPHLI